MSSRIFFLLSTLVLLLAVACTVSDGLDDGSVSAETNSTTDSSVDQSALETLALRLITPYYGYPGAPEPVESSLLVGQLPESYTFPMPDGTTIIGSLYQEDGNFRTVADSTLDPESIIAFFETEMETIGWKQPEMSQMGGGFVGSSEGLMFCDPEDETRILSISANDFREDAPTDLQINLIKQPEYSPCLEDMSNMNGPGVYGLLPLMKQPPGAQQTGGGGGSSGMNNANTSATLKTDLSTAEILSHYNSALEGEGWIMSSEEAASSVATSSWQWQDDEGDSYIGTFVALKNDLLPEQSLVLFEMTEAP